MAELTRTQVRKLKATFVVQTATDAPDNAQVLSTLTSGLLAVTTGTGVLSVATAGTDYVPPSRTITAGAGLSGGGDLSANRTISMPSVGPGAVTTGTAGITSIQTDLQGRIVALTTATYALASTTLTAGTGLSGGGDLSTNRTITNDLVTGKSGGQTATGGTGSGEGLVLRSTSDATKGFTSIGSTTTFTFDETNQRLGLGGASPECGIKIGGTTLGMSAVFGASSMISMLGIQNSDTGTFPGIVAGFSNASQMRFYWSSGGGQLSSVGAAIDIAPASAVTFYSTTGGRITSGGDWLVGNTGSSNSKIRILGTKTVASSTSLAWNALEVVASTLTMTGTTHVTTATGVNLVQFLAPTITDGSACTVDFAATLAVGGAPIAAGSATLTASYAFWVQGGVSRFDGNIDLSSGARNLVLDTTTGTKIGTATSQKLGFFNATPVVQQTRAATLTNSVTTGGTDDTIADFVGTTYLTDAGTIRNDIYQLARILRQHDVGLRALGLLS